MKITKLLRLSGGIILVLLICVGVSVFGLNISFRQERRAVERKQQLEELSRDLAETLDYLTVQVRKYAQHGNEEYYNNYFEEVEEKKTREKVMDKLRKLDAPEEDLELIQQAIEESMMLKNSEQNALSYAEEGDFQRARRIIFGDFYTKQKQKVMDPIEEFQADIRQKTAQQTAATQRRADFFLLLTNILLGLVLVALAVTFIILYRRISKPISKAVDFAEQIAQGNLDVEPLTIETDDEIGSLTQSLNKMLAQLKEIVAKLNSSIQDLSSYSQQLSATADQESSRVEQTIQDFDTMFSALDRVSAAHQEAIKSTQETNQEADAGEVNIQQTVTSIQEIDHKVATTVEVIEDLDGTTQEINKIVDLIDNIAEETNLLALNASIEASRAGEAGRGFAVVANKIRELAEETAEATSEISGLITEIQSKSETGLEAVQEVEEKAETSREIAEETGELFATIADSIQHTSTKIEETATATEKITETGNQVEETSGEINEMSEEIAKSANELDEMAQELKILIDEFDI